MLFVGDVPGAGTRRSPAPAFDRTLETPATRDETDVVRPRRTGACGRPLINRRDIDMTLTAPDQVDADLTARMQLQYRIEQFYYHEAALLDEHRYREWINLFTADTRYFMPLRRTMSRRELHKEFTKPGEMAFFDDDYGMLEDRVVKLETGTAWAEDPPSRTRHFVSNVRVLDTVENIDTASEELDVECNFFLYRTRLKSEENQWIGRRADTLRATPDGFMIAKRSIYLDQTLLLSGNLSNFF